MKRNRKGNYWKVRGYKITGSKEVGYEVDTLDGVRLTKQALESLRHAKLLILSRVK